MEPGISYHPFRLETTLGATIVMPFLRRLAALVAACVVTATTAATATTDFSDLWFNPNEEGWGVNLVQQDEILFITFFVYAASGQPTWFVGPATAYTGSSGGILSFTGPLYTTTGPYFGASSFNEASVVPRQVGFVSFATGQIGAGAISYTVDGVSVTKSIQRQTWRNENIGGIYTGAIAGDYSGCGQGVNGYYESPITINVGHEGGSTITMREEGADYFCNYNGTYTQSGRMGQVQGSGTCSDGTAQSFTATEVQGSIHALTMRLFSQFAGSCVFNGRLGGVRRGG